MSDGKRAALGRNHDELATDTYLVRSANSIGSGTETAYNSSLGRQDMCQNWTNTPKNCHHILSISEIIDSDYQDYVSPKLAESQHVPSSGLTEIV